MNAVAVALGATLFLAPVTAAPGAQSDTHRSPETNYMLHCQGCHRPDGSGVPGAVPDLRGHVSVFLGSAAGRAFLVRVPGAANAPISDADLAALLDWTVRRFDPGHVPADFAPYTASEVARLRDRKLSKVKDERAAILAALTSEDRAASPPGGSPPPGAAGGPDRQ